MSFNSPHPFNMAYGQASHERYTYLSRFGAATALDPDMALISPLQFQRRDSSSSEDMSDTSSDAQRCADSEDSISDDGASSDMSSDLSSSVSSSLSSTSWSPASMEHAQVPASSSSSAVRHAPQELRERVNMNSRAEATCQWPDGQGGVCGRHFTMRKNYDDHVEAVHGIQEPDGQLVMRRFACRMCTSEYAYKRCLTRHVLQKHGLKVVDGMFSVQYVPARRQ